MCSLWYFSSDRRYTATENYADIFQRNNNKHRKRVVKCVYKPLPLKTVKATALISIVYCRKIPKWNMSILSNNKQTGMFCISNQKSPKSLFLWPLLSTHSHWISTFVGYESGIMACFNSISIGNYSLIAVRLVYATENFPLFMIVLLFIPEVLVYQAVFVGGIFNTVIIFAVRIPWHTVLWIFIFTVVVHSSNDLFKSIFRLTATPPLKFCIADPMCWECGKCAPITTLSWSPQNELISTPQKSHTYIQWLISCRRLDKDKCLVLNIHRKIPQIWFHLITQLSFHLGFF